LPFYISAYTTLNELLAVLFAFVPITCFYCLTRMSQFACRRPTGRWLYFACSVLR